MNIFLLYSFTSNTHIGNRTRVSSLEGRRSTTIPYALRCAMTHYFFLFLGFSVWLACLSLDSTTSSGYSGSRLGEVSSHVLLKVEVSQLLALLQLQKLKKLGVRVDLATVVLVLKLLGANVGIDLASDLSAGKNASLRLAEEGSELVGDQSGLHESRRSAVSVGLATLVGLIRGTKLAGVLALKLVDLRADRSKKGLSALKLGKDAAVKSSGNRAVDLGNRGGGIGALNGGGRSRNRGGLGSLGSGSLGSSRLGRLGGGSSNGGCGGGRSGNRGGRRRSRLNHRT